MANDGSAVSCVNDTVRFAGRIDRAVYDINKNLEQMDFDNVDAKEAAREIADSMIRCCHDLMEELQNYHFE